MNCLLCPAIAVADCLCVECGAKLWVYELWEKDTAAAERFFFETVTNDSITQLTPKERAICEMSPGPRRIFMERLTKARAEHVRKNAEFDRLEAAREAFREKTDEC